MTDYYGRFERGSQTYPEVENHYPSQEQVNYKDNDHEYPEYHWRHSQAQNRIHADIRNVAKNTSSTYLPPDKEDRVYTSTSTNPNYAHSYVNSYTNYNWTETRAKAELNSISGGIDADTIDAHGLSGIMNMGNTCYMNSAIQCLSNTYHFRQYLFNSNFQEILQNNIPKIFSSIEKKDIPLNLDIDLNKIKPENYQWDKLTLQEQNFYMNKTMTFQLFKLIRGLWQNKNLVIPTSFKTVFSQAHNRRFFGNEQQDSQEALECMINQVMEELTVTNNDPMVITESDSSLTKISLPDINQLIYQHDIFQKIFEDKTIDDESKLQARKIYDDYKLQNPYQVTILKFYQTFVNEFKKNNNIITKMFFGMSQSHMQCPDQACQHYADKFETFFTLQLPLITNATKMDVYDCMEEYSKNEILDDNNKWNCEKCNQKVNGIKRITIALPPKILIIQLKRFGQNKKDGRFVDFPIKGLTLDVILGPNPIVQNKNYSYDLYAIVDHIGKSMHGGHYYSYCENNDKWYKYDDSKITQITSNPSSLITSAAYVLIYIRTDCLQEFESY